MRPLIRCVCCKSRRGPTPQALEAVGSPARRLHCESAVATDSTRGQAALSIPVLRWLTAFTRSRALARRPPIRRIRRPNGFRIREYGPEDIYFRAHTPVAMPAAKHFAPSGGPLVHTN